MLVLVLTSKHRNQMKLKLLISLLLIGIHGFSQNESVPRELIKEIKKISNQSLPNLTTMGKVADGTFYTIKNAKPAFYAYCGRVYTCRTSGCDTSNPSYSNANEFFDYFILYDETPKIIAVKIYSYEATHGHEIGTKGWLKQFIGYSGTRKLSVGKEIDAISGATTSANNITNDIYVKTKTLKKLIAKEQK
ncbi:MAG: hypothetical protein PWR03_1140 [Tenuifilum sp.]|jgi:hypothetical protein|nr:hypothetical protein [Tenuifilum sp.]